MYVLPITVEFEDVDAYGIVHHPKIFYYFERARVHFLYDNGLDLNKLSYGIVIRDVSVQFKQPLAMLDKINVELRVQNLEKFKFDFVYTIKKGDKIVIQGRIEMVPIDLDTKRIIPIPEQMNELLKKILN